MTRATLSTKFVRTKEAVSARVCKTVKPKHSKVNNPIPDSSQYKYIKIVLRIPDEYAYALEDAHKGKGLQYAIMHLIKEHVTPVSIE